MIGLTCRCGFTLTGTDPDDLLTAYDEHECTTTSSGWFGVVMAVLALAYIAITYGSCS